MQTINIHEAKTHLSKLVEQAAGELFIIAKAGKPLVKVTRLDMPDHHQIKHLGFLVGQITVPADFDQMVSETMELLFNDDLCRCCSIHRYCCGRQDLQNSFH